MNTEIIVNGKIYPLWNSFVADQSKWIGGTLEDYDIGASMTTIIVNIELTPNGDDSAFFRVNGAEFSCGFDVKYGGIQSGDKDWITFSGYAGHEWRIRKP